jgi:TonB family protein
MGFHLKGHFTGGATKDSTGEGTYELTWISPDQWRMDLTLARFSLTKIANPKGVYQLTPDMYEPMAAAEVERDLFPYLLRPGKDATLQHVTLRSGPAVRVGHGTMQGGTINLPESAWYFTSPGNQPFLHTRKDEVVTYTRMGTLHGQLALLDFTHQLGNDKLIVFHTDQLTSNPTPDAALFVVPEDAQLVKPALTATRAEGEPGVTDPAPGEVHVSSGLIASKKIAGQPPVYPEYAKINKIQGHVVIYMVIDKQGVPHDMHVVSSPDSSLSQAALESVATFRYSPTMLSGKATLVGSTVDVNFTFDNGRR